MEIDYGNNLGKIIFLMIGQLSKDLEVLLLSRGDKHRLQEILV